MKNKIFSLLMTVGLLCGLSLTSCKDEESGVANAVIASTHAITFPINDPAPVSIEVVSDGTWHVETPEWITCTPNTGEAGKTEVIITVPENTRGGAPDLPRKYTLKFMGEKSLSASDVLISQLGDKYRDLAPITIPELDGLDDDAAAMLSDVIVYSATEKNIVVTDGTNLAYVKGLKASKGDKVLVSGSKFDADKLPYIEGETLELQGTASVPTFAATDITENLDKYTSDKLTVVKVTGAFDGTNVKVAGMTNSVQIVDSSKEFKIADYAGHQIEVTGVYQGTASPVVKLIATEIVDKGLNEIILFKDDFEWFLETNILTYTGKDGWVTSDNVGDNQFKDVYNPQAGTLKTPDGKSVWDILTEKGYKMASTSTTQAKKSVGCARNYIKMAVTTYTAALTLPAMPEAGDGIQGVKLQFDWVPFAGSGGIYDPTEIVVVIENGNSKEQIAIDKLDIANNTPYAWHRELIDLSGYTINKDTRITLRNADAQFPESTAVNKTCRWFLDNIKVYVPKE